MAIPLIWVTSLAGRSSIGILLPSAERKIQSRNRRSHIEGDVVLFGQHRHRIGADLVGGVAVGGDPVGSDDAAGDLAATHEKAGHVVGDQRSRNPVLHQLPGGQAGSLQPGAGLVGKDLDLLAGFVGGADDSQGGTVTGRGQSAGIAVGQDRGPFRDQGGAPFADVSTDGQVLLLDPDGLFFENLRESGPAFCRDWPRPPASCARCPRTG